MSNICNFFALLDNGAVKKIDLTQDITGDIRDVFIGNSTKIKTQETEEILFDGNYRIDEDEVLYVELQLSDELGEANTNSIGLDDLDLSNDKIKSLFWIENDVYYFQNFDKRKLLTNKHLLFFDGNTYNKFSENALIVENMVNAIYENGKFYFKSYANANKIISLMDFFQEASEVMIEEFANNSLLSVDKDWLKQSTSPIKKQITLIQKSGLLQTVTIKKITSSAKKFNFEGIEIENDKIKLPNDKKKCKDILCFLNEQYYIGLITGKKFRTNSKREI
ncbi:hypothetical protein [Capnocytophaga felis]|uniref:DUF4868 domain-containing protein n=1 Tax=Capnocytophaga felis TaxID=2267611 RepID=A0A5M4B5M7_9FLAO|nr:hypothetical protein [Capnocytophaga felis]GET44894.1 hypothetical protein RCZ01_01960 [Capnocytophaga felis]GET49346.1 hypothetical protein RCZ02_21770 [Capnocytophaga felis]